MVSVSGPHDASLAPADAPHLDGEMKRALKRLASAFDVSHVVGVGGGGVVYRATRRSDGTLVALKLGRFDTVEARRRWTREVGSLSRVSHPRVASLIEQGVVKGTDFAYVATRFVDGPTLEAWLRTKGWLDRPTGCRMVLQVLEGLAEVHRVGLVHRDVKATNVIVETVEGLRSAVLVDFGIAHSYSSELTPWSRLTYPGQFMGTADYVAPERIQGASGDARTDVWSAGILLHRVIYGYTPFHARTPLLTLDRAVSDPVVAPWRDRCEVSSTEIALFEVVLQALDKRPEHRFDDAAEMGRALARALEGGELSPHAGAWLASREEDTAPLPTDTGR